MFKKYRAPSVLGILLLGIPMLTSIAGCGPTMSDQVDACIALGDWRATSHCENKVWRAHGYDDAARLGEAFEKLNDATWKYVDAERDAAKRLNDQYRRGEITLYDYRKQVCDMYGSEVGHCANVGVVDSEGHESNTVVEW